MRSGVSHRLSMLALACVVLCSACTTTKELVVLLTGEDGTIGSVAVTAPAGALVLTTPLAAAAISSAGEVTPSTTTPEAAQQLAYTAGAEAMPRPARSFRLYFREKSADIVATSLPELETLLAEVAKRDAAEVESPVIPTVWAPWLTMISYRSNAPKWCGICCANQGSPRSLYGPWAVANGSP